MFAMIVSCFDGNDQLMMGMVQSLDTILTEPLPVKMTGKSLLLITVEQNTKPEV